MIRFLQQQNSTLKILLGAVIGLFIIVLVITLVPGIYDWNNVGNTAGVLVKVGDRPLKTQDVERTADAMMRRQRLPEQFKAMVMPRIIEQMVTEQALLEQAHRVGLQVTDQELQDELHAGQFGQALFPNGQFIGQDKYMDFIQNNFNMSVERFEELVKDQLLLEKLQSVVAGAASVSDGDVKQAFEKQNAKVKLDYAYFTVPDLQKGINPTDAELRAFYEKNKAQYANTIPEKRKLKYAVVDTSKAGANITATPQELQSYYDQHKQQFQVKERVKVAHILITPKPGKDGKPDDAAARAKAEDLLKQLKAGANFAELAKTNSEDPGSGASGGELGFITRGMTVPEFEKAAFALNPGQLSDLVHTSFGYHIIKSEQKESAHAQPFDEVKPQIEQAVLAQKRNQAVTNYIAQIQADVKSEGPDKAAQKFGLDVKTSDFVSQNDPVPGIGPAPEFMQAAFQQSKGSATVAPTGQNYALVEPLEIQPAATPTFEQAKAQVEQQFKQQRAQELLQRKTQELADRAKTENDLKKAAQATGATFKSSDFVGANDTVAELGSFTQGPAAVAFTLDKGQISGAENSGTTGFVLAVADKKLPTADEFAQAKNTVRSQLLNQKRNQNFALFAEETRTQLEKDGKIKFNKDEEKRLGIGGGPAGQGQ
jgi:peptidyl-prolyl cis-trans isomerase D